MYRGCFPRLFRGVLRVKQHLSRVHTPTFYCQRCLTVFANEDEYSSHISPNGCRFEPLPSDGAHFVTFEVRTQLLRKQSPLLSEKQRWFAIWDMLFPRCPQPQSPYVDTSLSLDMAQFREYFNSYGQSIISDAFENDTDLLKNRVWIGLEYIYDTWLTCRKSNTLSTCIGELNSHSLGLGGSHSSIVARSAAFEMRPELPKLSQSNQDDNVFIEPISDHTDNTDSAISVRSDFHRGWIWDPSSDAAGDCGSPPGDMSADINFLLGLHENISRLERMKLDKQRQIDDFLSQREDLRGDYARLIAVPQDDGGSDGPIGDRVPLDVDREEAPKFLRTWPVPEMLEPATETTGISSESDTSSQESDDIVLPEEMAIFEATLQTVFGLTVEEANISVDKWKPLVLDFVKGLHAHVWLAPEGADEPEKSQSIPRDGRSLQGEGAPKAPGKRAREIGGNGIEDNTNGGNTCVRAAKKPRIGETLGLRFSCPYRKRNPERFNVRQRYSCSMTFFSTIAKVR